MVGLGSWQSSSALNPRLSSGLSVTIKGKTSMTPLCLRRVRELEQRLEAKKKLGGKGRPAPPPSDSSSTAGADKGEKGRKGNKGGPQGGQDK